MPVWVTVGVTLLLPVIRSPVRSLVSYPLRYPGLRVNTFAFSLKLEFIFSSMPVCMQKAQWPPPSKSWPDSSSLLYKRFSETRYMRIAVIRTKAWRPFFVTGCRHNASDCRCEGLVSNGVLLTPTELYAVGAFLQEVNTMIASWRGCFVLRMFRKF